MFSDQELQRIESTIRRLRDDIRRLDTDEGEARERADRAIRHIQADLERDVTIIKRRKQDLEREIDRHEHDLENRRKGLERNLTKSH